MVENGGCGFGARGIVGVGVLCLGVEVVVIVAADALGYTDGAEPVAARIGRAVKAIGGGRGAV